MIYEHLGARPRIHDTAVVAPTAVISGDVEIGQDCQVLHGAVITAEGGPITLGEHVIVMENALIRATAADAVHIGDHTLVDTETGERRRVKDHPALRELVMQSEAVHAENERLRIEAASRDKHRNRMVMLLGVLVVIAAGIGGGVFWYEKHRAVEKVVIKEPGEPQLNFEISMKVDPPEKKAGGHRHGGKSGPKNGAFDDTTTLGDASEGGGDETLDGATVQRVMSQNFKVLVGCVQEERHRNPGLHNVDMDFIIKGSGNGTPSELRLSRVFAARLASMMVHTAVANHGKPAASPKNTAA